MLLIPVISLAYAFVVYPDFALPSSLHFPHFYSYPFVPSSPLCCHVIVLSPMACIVAVMIPVALPWCSTTERMLHQDQTGASHETGGQTSGTLMHIWEEWALGGEVAQSCKLERSHKPGFKVTLLLFCTFPCWKDQYEFLCCFMLVCCCWPT